MERNTNTERAILNKLAVRADKTATSIVQPGWLINQDPQAAISLGLANPSLEAHLDLVLDPNSRLNQVKDEFIRLTGFYQRKLNQIDQTNQTWEDYRAKRIRQDATRFKEAQIESTAIITHDQARLLAGLVSQLNQTTLIFDKQNLGQINFGPEILQEAKRVKAWPWEKTNFATLTDEQKKGLRRQLKANLSKNLTEEAIIEYLERPGVINHLVIWFHLANQDYNGALVELLDQSASTTSNQDSRRLSVTSSKKEIRVSPKVAKLLKERQLTSKNPVITPVTTVETPTTPIAEPIALSTYQVSAQSAVIFGNLIFDLIDNLPIDNEDPNLTESIQEFAVQLASTDKLNTQKILDNFYTSRRSARRARYRIEQTFLAIFRAPEDLYESIIEAQKNQSVKESLSVLLHPSNRPLHEAIRSRLIRLISSKSYRDWIILKTQEQATATKSPSETTNEPSRDLAGEITPEHTAEEDAKHEAELTSPIIITPEDIINQDPKVEIITGQLYDELSAKDLAHRLNVDAFASRYGGYKKVTPGALHPAVAKGLVDRSLFQGAALSHKHKLTVNESIALLFLLRYDLSELKKTDAKNLLTIIEKIVAQKEEEKAIERKKNPYAPGK